jgi:hypothetical protein
MDNFYKNLVYMLRNGPFNIFNKTQSNNLIKIYDSGAKKVVYDSDSNTFKSKTTIECIINSKGLCDTCDTYHIVSPDEYHVECVVCKSRVPLINANIAFTSNNFIRNEHMYFNVELDPSIYNDDELTDLMISALNGGQIPLVKIFCKVNSEFKYCDRKWYYCVDKVWQITNENYTLGGRIVDVLKKQLSKIVIHYSLTHSDDLFIKINKIIKYLGKTSTQRELPNICKHLLRDDTIVELLDSKHNLLPFKNGVCEFFKDSYIFRQIRKEDYVRKYLNYDFNPNVDTTKFDNLISSIIRDTGVREYMLQKCSTTLKGDIETNQMFIFTGDGSNGKSVLMNLIMQTFGKFSVKLHIDTLKDISVIDVKELAKLRMVYFSEPRSDDKLDGCILKELMTRRGAKIFLTCEHVPEIKASSDTFWQRTSIISLDSKFVDEPNPKKSNEFKLDSNLFSKIKNDMDYSNGFVKRLIEYYYKPQVSVPKAILDKSEYYLNSSNALYTWLKANVIRGNKRHILTKDLKACYKLVPGNHLVHAMEIFLECNFPGIKTTRNRFMVNGDRVNGWKGVGLRDR